MAVKIKKSSALTKLNMTPMIDIVFQLLIFFFVAARYEAAENEMNLVLPKADEAMARIAKPKEITINLDAGGRIFITGHLLNHEELLGVLRQGQADNPGRTTVIIRGDEKCDLKHVVGVMNACAKVDIKDCRIAAAAPQ